MGSWRIEHFKFILILLSVSPPSFSSEVSSIGIEDWRVESTLPLVGPWDFYWNQLREPTTAESPPTQRLDKIKSWVDIDFEDKKIFGFATYETLLKDFPALSKSYSITIEGIKNSAKLYVVSADSGEVLAERSIGDPALNKGSKRALRADFHLSRSQDVRIILQVANHQDAYKKIKMTPILSTSEAATASYNVKNLLNILSIGVCITVAIYSLLIYLRRKEDKASLMLTFLSLGLLLRSLATTDFFVQIDTDDIYYRLFIVLEYISIPTMTLGGCLFIKAAFFPSRFQRVSNLLSFSSILLIGIGIFSSVYMLTSLREVFQLFGAIFVIILFVALAYAYKKKYQDINVLIVGCSFPILGALYDIIIVSTLGFASTFIMPLCNAIFLFLQSQLVARRSAQAHDKADRYARELVEKDKARTLFFHNTSHELRTPLNGIIGYLDLVINERYGKLPLDASNQIKKSLKLVNALKFQVNTILDLAKSKKGELNATYQDLNVKRIFDDCLNLAEGLRLKTSDVVFQATFEGEERFIGDQEKIVTIIRNLLGNAFKFKDPHRENLVELAVVSSKDCLNICVCDTGIGIPSEYQSKIFEEFAQVEGDARRRFEGSGLGLAMVKDLVELMNGQIFIDSEVDKGSKFYVSIPSHALSEHVERDFNTEVDVQIAQSETPTPDQKSHKLTNLAAFDSNWKVLVIDDNETNCEVMTEILASEGYGLRYALSGKSGLEMMNEFNPHVVLLDMMMPEMSGEDVLAAIRNNEKFKNTAVILVTARASEEDRIYGLSLGANDYLPKPIVADELRLRVHNLMERERNYQMLLESYKKIKEVEKKSDSLASELTAANRQLIQAEKMVLLGQLLANVAHDMASPSQLVSLTAGDLAIKIAEIQTRFEALIGDAQDEESEEVLKLFSTSFSEALSFTDNIKLGIKRMIDIQVALRNQARHENERQSFVLKEVVDECLIILNSKLSQVKVDIQGDEKLYCFANRSEIGQLITNILSNACDAIEESTKKKQIFIIFDLSPETKQVTITIEDSGNGIPAQDEERIFQAFYTSKAVGKGTGLGLSICKKIAQNNCGSIYTKKPLRLSGAAFEIVLPHRNHELKSA